MAESSYPVTIEHPPGQFLELEVAHSDVLQAQLDEVKLGEAVKELKAARSLCGECGRVKADAELEEQLAGVKAEHAMARRFYRLVRNAYQEAVING